MKVSESDFLLQHGESWTARQAAGFSVVNIHAKEISAPAERVFPELSAQELLAPAWYWKILIRLRGAIGKIFGWDRGLAWHPPRTLEAGKHYAFFMVEWVDPPSEVGMSVRNHLTNALMCWVLEERAEGTKVYNVTLASFAGRQGRCYWRFIRPFHDALIEHSLAELAHRMQRRLEWHPN